MKKILLTAGPIPAKLDSVKLITNSSFHCKEHMKQIKVTKKMSESIKALMAKIKLPTCDHITYGLDSFDYARGDHLCHNIAMFELSVPKANGYNSGKYFCKGHAPKNSSPVPYAEAYEALYEASHAEEMAKRKKAEEKRRQEVEKKERDEFERLKKKFESK